MKNISKILSLLVVVSLVGMGSLHAELYIGDPVKKTTPSRKAADCMPASGSSQLSVNNVRAYIETSGSMWFNNSKAQYFVPREGNASSMFAAALWIGGMDRAGQLKLAALRFKQQGQDFWPGPLNLLDASIDQATCSMYDKHFYMTKMMAKNHRDSFNIAGYVMPKEIKQWPGNPIDGNKNQSWYIAPYVDVNNNGVYDPENGDYPYYDFDNALCPWTEANRALAAANALPQTMETKDEISTGGIMADQVLKGDATLWWIFNDKGAAHTESKGSPIGLEIRAQAFGFATTDELNNMTFYSYEIINRSTYELTETYFSQWVDPDLGYSKDDYVGCDVERGLGYCYNGTMVDGNGLNTEYGANPPAVGVDFFQGPYLDPDGYDNPSYKGDNFYGPSFSAKVNYGANVCDIVTAHENLREFTWSIRYDSINEKWIDTTAYVPVRAEAINGVNFGDGIKDNERFGMRRFVYHNNDNSLVGDPSVAVDYYNMLRGIWKDNTPMRFGRNGHYAQTGTNAPQCDFMFPGDSDPCNWGTKGVDPGQIWTEENVGNPPGDRRFMQSAGPFTLKAGAINYITVGIPWARATGTPWASVMLLKAVDDKAQILFESCFKVVDGPDAPDLVFQEMDKSLICYISNSHSSNNFKEEYKEEDPSIPKERVKTSVQTIDSVYTVVTDTLKDINGLDSLVYEEKTIKMAIELSDTIPYDRNYVFEGYQIFQLANASVGAAELTDNSKARLAYQCDIKNGVARIINYEYDANVETEVPLLKVDGADEGIVHSFELNTDLFGGVRLVNNQKYYYMAIAYAYNNYEQYTTSADNPDGLFGQKTPYLSGNKNVKIYTVIPHKTDMENNGTIANSVYGTQPQITQLEGQGNGGNALYLTKQTLNEILEKGRADSLVFEINAGPIGVKVIDPLKVHGADYFVRFYTNDTSAVTDSTRWRLEYTTASGVDTVIESEQPISVQNEQLFLDLGISITINNAKFSPLADYINADNKKSPTAYYLYSTVEFLTEKASNVGTPFVAFMRDNDIASSVLNWIRAGQTKDGDWALNDHTYKQKRAEDYYFALANSDKADSTGITYGNASTYTCWLDRDKNFNNIWAPYALTSIYDNGPGYGFESPEYQDAYGNPLDSIPVNEIQFRTTFPTMTELYSVDIVLTSDTNLWTRCPVVEIGSDSLSTVGRARRHDLRKSPSVGKDGKPDGTGYGMSWFPGYAICIETGERLNIMFGEDSRVGGDGYNGTDMIFNPGERITYESTEGWIAGGGHYVYIMGHRNMYKEKAVGSYGYENVPTTRICPAYDEGQWLYNQLNNVSNMALGAQRNIAKNYIYKNVMWVGMPLGVGSEMAEGSEMTFHIRVSRPYQKWSSTTNVGVNNPTNDNLPLYKFTTKNIATMYNQQQVAETQMDSIYIVPNPYYGVAVAGYEESQIDTRVKLVNLPASCKIKIYTLNGTLIRSFNKDDESTILEWDLKNSANIPIASGMYLIHVRDNKYNTEKVVKFLCIQRPFDVNAY